uniref:Uncharacterized protein n=2 Tax=viral metagenome TaxID=1070528 RepID=A0A6M3KHQ2_9ZZZZ
MQPERGVFKRKMKSNLCPINPQTKEKYECSDCKFRDACIEDILNDLQQSFIKKAAKVGKDIGKLLKERKGI